MATRKHGKRKLKDPEFWRKFDFDVRKHVHVKLFSKTKSELKTIAYRMDLTLQEIFEVFAHALINENTHLITMLNEYKRDKRNKETLDLMSEMDKDSLLEAIQDLDE